MPAQPSVPLEGSGPCPSPEDVQAYLGRRCNEVSREAIVRHVDGCDACREWLANLASLAASAPAGDNVTSDELPQVGRYRIQGEIGRGAMGVVYRAHDPRLGRAVAIKLIEAAGADLRERVRREARAMARLRDPNVVGVLDFGTSSDSFFIVMELVQGQTLRAWQRKRPWLEVVRAYVQAGRGLAEAHRCDIVHRDFKPDNVLVGDEDTVRVTDFGLARGPGCHPESTTAEHEAEVAPERTRTGALVGTLAYMAPEQLRGQEATAASDQFAFCVAVWEGATGSRPFDGTSIDALLEAMQRGPSEHAARDLPPRVVDVLRQSLQVAPQDRHCGMDALLTALEAACEPRRSRPWAWALAGLGVLAAGTLSSFALGARFEAPIDASVQPTKFDPDVEAELRARMEAIRQAADASQLDGLASTCAALQAEVDAGPDPALASELSLVCSDVDLGLGRIDAANEKVETAYFASRAAGADVIALEASTRRLLVALFEQGDYPAAETWLAHAQSELDRAYDGRLHALVSRAAASLWAHQGDYDRAFDATEEGAAAAQANGLDALEILLLEEQANLLRSQLRHEEALRLYAQLLERADALGGDPLDSLNVRIGLGRTLSDAGRHEDALARYDEVLALLEGHTEHGDRVWAAEVTDLRGDALLALGRLSEARDAELACRQELERVGALSIPTALSCRTERLAIDARLGHCGKIEADLSRHIDHASARLGPLHPDTADARLWNGYCRLVTGEVGYGIDELSMVLEAYAERPHAPAARLARALLEAEHWGIPAASALR